jgi:hypothetical protein
MVDYHYDENVHQSLRKRRRYKVAAWALAGTLVIAIILIIWDGLRSDTTVSTQTPPQTRGATVEQVVFDEPTFKLTADGTWRKIETREETEYHYQSVSDNLVRRDLRVYVNFVPTEFSITHVLPIEVEDNRVIPLTISPDCESLVPDKKSPRDQTTEWAGVTFICDPDSSAYVVGTSHNQTGYKATVPSGDNKNRFFFVYRDLEPEPRLETFSNLLRNFEAK